MNPSVFLVGLLAGTLSAACADRSRDVPATGPERIRQFVQETIDLELKGERWRELTDQTTTSRLFYERFAWPSETEPGWDTFFVSDSCTISRLGGAESRPIDEYENGDVRARTAEGVSVDVQCADTFKFGTDWFQKAGPSVLAFFVIERRGTLLIADRLHQPRFNTSAALHVLGTDQFKAPALDALRGQLRSARPR